MSFKNNKGTKINNIKMSLLNSKTYWFVSGIIPNSTPTNRLIKLFGNLGINLNILNAIATAIKIANVEVTKFII